MRILEKLGIYGWSTEDENVILASILTGEPLLMLAEHGTSKTGAASLFAKAFGFKYHPYDASKDLFDDVVGFIDIEALKNGTVRYLESEVTIFDKEFVLIDEINRAKKEMQSKWLEILRSRTIMGMTTKVNWVWAACNPVNYHGANNLDQALIGRFAYFLYPPAVSSMNKEDRIKIASNISVSDQPGLGYWTDNNTGGMAKLNLENIGVQLKEIVSRAAKHYEALQGELPEIPKFISYFGKMIMDESKGNVNLDGRRLGYMTRAVYAIRSIEIARAEILDEIPGSLRECIKYSLKATIPTSINDDTVNTEEDMHVIESTLKMISGYVNKNIDNNGIDKIYKLFTSDSIPEVAELLLCEDLPDMAKSKAWENLISTGGLKIQIIALLTLYLEAIYPNTIPEGIGGQLSSKINVDNLSANILSDLTGDDIERAAQVNQLTQSVSTDFEKYLIVSLLGAAINKGSGINVKAIQKEYNAILDEISVLIKKFKDKKAA